MDGSAENCVNHILSFFCSKLVQCSVIHQKQQKTADNKKVLLRDCKRYTDGGVACPLWGRGIPTYLMGGGVSYTVQGGYPYPDWDTTIMSGGYPNMLPRVLLKRDLVPEDKDILQKGPGTRGREYLSPEGTASPGLGGPGTHTI